MKFKGYSLKHALGALAFGAALLLGTSDMAYAQGHHQRDLREHQRQERYYYDDSHALRDRQRRERRGYYNDRYYYNSPYNRGYYGNGWGLGNGWGSGNGWGLGWGHHHHHGW